ncbi:MAG: hypothetical protein F4065_06775 [Rhodothermaceae bacterium]|nr:hypothetical protein [Rhodothermaceae bacterium]MXZ57569.1 hypothetical protein [Rhodothermaceae bacterium]MYB90553.1 hypothetical protein [Rhodothermaceae bacterium]MYD68140.1 hypothetical protein [Rhodothermaceae bacterium]MYG44132.1 hypothetical protein [Rhodothermaceae bacterium]
MNWKRGCFIVAVCSLFVIVLLSFELYRVPGPARLELLEVEAELVEAQANAVACTMQLSATRVELLATYATILDINSQTAEYFLSRGRDVSALLDVAELTMAKVDSLESYLPSDDDE